MKTLKSVDDSAPDMKGFVERYRKMFPGRDPSSEVSLKYTSVHVTAVAMKLAGTVTDAAAIRAQLDKAFKTMPPARTPHGIGGVDERGGSTADPRVAIVENGKIREVKLSAIR